jgi:hypothetical protein
MVHYNPEMDQPPDLHTIDYDELKQQIAEAIREVIREEAAKLGISYQACYELIFGKQT